MARHIKKYGWIPDLPDWRDHRYAAPAAVLEALPPRVDLRDQCPPVYDQGDLGSCTAQAIAGAVQFDLLKQQQRDPFTPSRLFIYYNERLEEGTVDEDAGAMLRDGIKTVAQLGAAHEQLWPYVVSKFRTRPASVAYLDAERHQALLYQRLTPTIAQLKGCLASGFPFVFGFAVYESFEDPAVARSGHAPLPGADETLLGGHAVMAAGYDDANGWFLLRNSWGPGWGLRGYFTLPYAYLTTPDLSDDFWTIRLME